MYHRTANELSPSEKYEKIFAFNFVHQYQFTYFREKRAWRPIITGFVIGALFTGIALATMLTFYIYDSTKSTYNCALSSFPMLE